MHHVTARMTGFYANTKDQGAAASWRSFAGQRLWGKLLCLLQLVNCGEPVRGIFTLELRKKFSPWRPRSPPFRSQSRPCRSNSLSRGSIRPQVLQATAGLWVPAAAAVLHQVFRFAKLVVLCPGGGMADAEDLKSSGVLPHGGSSPPPGTIKSSMFMRIL